MEATEWAGMAERYRPEAGLSSAGIPTVIRMTEFVEAARYSRRILNSGDALP